MEVGRLDEFALVGEEIEDCSLSDNSGGVVVI